MDLLSAFAAAAARAPRENVSFAQGLERSHAQALAAWPGVNLSGTAWASHLGRVLPDLGEQPDALAQRNVADLYLAAAVLARDPAAERAFEAHVGPGVDRQLTHLGLDADAAAEVRQRLRLKLLLGREHAPALLDYRGDGDIRVWTKVIATRLALDLKREQNSRHQHLEPEEVLVPAGRAPSNGIEGKVQKREKRALLLEALAEALAELEDRERTLLRLHFLAHSSIDVLAPAYGVHRTTVGRWLRDAQKRLHRALDRSLAKRGITPTDRAEVLDATMSNMELSLSTIFGPPK